jgi:hypothetical protein
MPNNIKLFLILLTPFIISYYLLFEKALASQDFEDSSQDSTTCSSYLEPKGNQDQVLEDLHLRTTKLPSHNFEFRKLRVQNHFQPQYYYNKQHMLFTDTLKDRFIWTPSSFKAAPTQIKIRNLSWHPKKDETGFQPLLKQMNSQNFNLSLLADSEKIDLHISPTESRELGFLVDSYFNDGPIEWGFISGNSKDKIVVYLKFTNKILLYVYSKPRTLPHQKPLRERVIVIHNSEPLESQSPSVPLLQYKNWVFIGGSHLKILNIEQMLLIDVHNKTDHPYSPIVDIRNFEKNSIIGIIRYDHLSLGDKTQRMGTPFVEALIDLNDLDFLAK